MTEHTFYAIRAKISFPGYSENSPYMYEPGWFASQSGMKPNFSNAKLFSSEAKAKKFLSMAARFVCPDGLTQGDCFEIVPVLAQVQ